MEVKEDRRGEGEGIRSDSIWRGKTHFEHVRTIVGRVCDLEMNKGEASSQQHRVDWTKEEEEELDTLKWVLERLFTRDEIG